MAGLRSVTIFGNDETSGESSDEEEGVPRNFADVAINLLNHMIPVRPIMPGNERTETLMRMMASDRRFYPERQEHNNHNMARTEDDEKKNDNIEQTIMGISMHSIELAGWLDRLEYLEKSIPPQKRFDIFISSAVLQMIGEYIKGVSFTRKEWVNMWKEVIFSNVEQCKKMIKKECILCLESADILSLPCGHSDCCVECVLRHFYESSEQLSKSSAPCPTCRSGFFIDKFGVPTPNP
jgi:hypothetical protein